MDGQKVVGRLNARALLTPTERRSLNCGSAPAPAWRDDPERLKTLLDHDVDLHRAAVEERGSAWRSCPTIARRRTLRAGHSCACWKTAAGRSPLLPPLTARGRQQPAGFRLSSGRFVRSIGAPASHRVGGGYTGNARKWSRHIKISVRRCVTRAIRCAHLHGRQGETARTLDRDVSHRSALERAPEQVSRQSANREISPSESIGHTMAVGSI
jgi:hypothetical protein